MTSHSDPNPEWYIIWTNNLGTDIECVIWQADRCRRMFLCHSYVKMYDRYYRCRLQTPVIWINPEVKGPPDGRQYMRHTLHKQVSRIISRHSDNPVLEKFMTKLTNALPNLFLFVTDTSIPATNNAAERGLRELVVYRKVRGAIRSSDTMNWLANIFTCVMTWRERGTNHIAQLAAHV